MVRVIRAGQGEETRKVTKSQRKYKCGIRSQIKTNANMCKRKTKKKGGGVAERWKTEILFVQIPRHRCLVD